MKRRPCKPIVRASDLTTDVLASLRTAVFTVAPTRVSSVNCFRVQFFQSLHCSHSYTRCLCMLQEISPQHCHSPVAKWDLKEHLPFLRQTKMMVQHRVAFWSSYCNHCTMCRYRHTHLSKFGKLSSNLSSPLCTTKISNISKLIQIFLSIFDFYS